MSQPLDLSNIQGDILGGLPKKTATNFFFQIVDAGQFRKQLSKLIPLITTVDQVQKDRDAIKDHKQKNGNQGGLIKVSGVNISFSHFGLVKMGIDDSKLGDSSYLKGQRLDAESLNDKGTGTGPTFDPDWLPPFKQEIHGLIIFTGDSHGTVNAKVKEVLGIFGVGTPGSSIKEVTRIRGDVRPGKNSGHEHFGFLDGISNPTVIGFDTNPNPGPASVRPGIILLGRDGDGNADKRDPWMVDGSFLAFRYLFQLVPEFNKFLDNHALKVPGMSKEAGSELLGARLVGRWKSGAPIDLRPFIDDAKLATDPGRNNDFSYAAETNFQKICPFAAHTRKTNPRADLNNNVENQRILRRGIQFGPELTEEETTGGKTIEDRGLVFQCYQSSIQNGFHFIQTLWANNATFPFTESTPETPGLDPLIGQAAPGQTRKMSGINPDDPSQELELPVWIVPRGGEYFFAPSLKGLKETIAVA
ncbi:hypothetical protein AMATHDRAFT_68188 [Amanita thiersii Skay4041]|uniref:Dyp-type peroxidase n=1 Tax=Amanita thiersii Skay4041 TaxID=703135 RepID=A0A2A9NHT6_9AGAR|nr:hypothetical protein AMATHDRAFT_68188 [Amanita thiersii Skay4041]